MGVLIPAKIYVEFDAADIPPPVPSGGGNLIRKVKSLHGPVETTSQAFEPSGIKQAITVAASCKIDILISGVMGHNMTGAAVTIKLARDGVLLFSGDTLASVRVTDSYDYRHFHIDAADTVVAGTYEYELWVCQSSGTVGSKGFVGRRGLDTAPNIKTSIKLEAYIDG
jgi:hypothetical protein